MGAMPIRAPNNMFQQNRSAARMGMSVRLSEAHMPTRARTTSRDRLSFSARVGMAPCTLNKLPTSFHTTVDRNGLTINKRRGG
jgi:hypothetical protein